MCSVQFDGVESAIFGPSGCLAVFFDQFVDFIDGHLLGVLPGKLHGPYAGGSEGPLAGNTLTGKATTVSQLQTDLGPAGVYLSLIHILSGLVGSGRTEFVRLLIGVDKMDEGEVRVNGKKAEIHSLQDALDKYRIGYVTENRKEEGLILYNTVGFNLTIGIWKRLANRFRRINTKEEQRTICDMIRKMEVKTPDEKTKVSSLSGGNQQKISIGKWLAAQCDILIIDEPTVGVDIGAKEYIHDLIWDLADKEPKSIILISSDMPERCV